MPSLNTISDAEFGSSWVAKWRAEFDADVATLKEFVPPELPRSMTPADLHDLYTAQRYFCSWQWSFASITAKWYRRYNEMNALRTKREAEDNRARFGYIVKNAGDVAKLKSQEQRLTYAGDVLDLDSLVGLAYLTDLTKGWYSHFDKLYSRVEHLASSVLTQLGILRSELNVHGRTGNSD